MCSQAGAAVTPVLYQPSWTWRVAATGVCGVQILPNRTLCGWLLTLSMRLAFVLHVLLAVGGTRLDPGFCRVLGTYRM